jgi:dolichyl-phosphate-mannose--protein O-mannosyl transferase
MKSFFKNFLFTYPPSQTQNGLATKTPCNFKSFLRVGGIIILILIGSFILHFWNLGQPHEIVFDELYFGSFVNNYFHHTQYFDIHPPLGKLLIAGTVKLAGFNGTNFDFKNIGEDYKDVPIYWFRFLPALAGSLLPLIIFLFVLSLGGSLFAANTAAFLVVFDNALLTQSRFVFVDIFLLAFGFLGLTFFFWGIKNKIFKKKIILFITSGIFFGLAVSIKWTGLGFLAPALLYFLYDDYKNKYTFLNIKIAVLMGTIILALYFSFFVIHFALLTPKDHNMPFKSFYGTNFWQFEDYAPTNFLKPTWRYIGEFFITNQEMYLANKSITAQHPYASTWLQWPLMQKPLYEWTKNTNMAGMLQRIYLIGNPATWFLSTIFMLLLPLLFLKFFLEKKRVPSPFIFLLILFLFNWLPFALIKRPMFIYHYLAALSIGLVATAFVSDYLLIKYTKRIKWVIIMIASGIIILGFYKILPLSYGLAIPDSWLFRILL